MATKVGWVTNPDGTKGKTWNPITGCTKISPGCKNCYAERMARRLAGRFGYPEAPHHFDVTLHPDKLDVPLRWKKPRTVFVCSMGDLFHEDVPVDFVDNVFSTMEFLVKHTFMVLTKRPENMKKYVRFSYPFGLPKHIRLGVTAENQAAADERREAFKQCPAAVKFISYEPAIGPVDWTGWEFVNWIISGGETGPGATPSHPDWHRAARDFCRDSGMDYFFKSWGEWKQIQFDKRGRGDVLVSPRHGVIDRLLDPFPDAVGRDDFKRSVAMAPVGKKAAGRLLDGREWSEMPDLTRGDFCGRMRTDQMPSRRAKQRRKTVPSEWSEPGVVSLT